MPKDKLDLFEEEPVSWEKEWQGMPEFCNEDLTPVKSIVVNFEKKEDMEKFSELIDQRVTFKTKSVWFPKQTLENIRNKRYINEDES